MRGIEAYGVGLTCCCALVACLAGAVACGKEEPAAGYAPHGKRSDQEEDAKDASTAPRRGTAGDDEPVPGDPSGELVATGDCSADDVLPENLGWNPNAGQFLTCPKDAEKLTTMLGDLSLSLGTADLDGCFRCLREIRGDLHFYGKNLSAAEFPSLRSIGGSVRFEGTTIESLRFPVLTRLGGIYIRSNTTLHELTMNGPTEMGDVLIDAKALPDLSPLSSLKKVGGLAVYGPGSLQGLSALTSARYIELHGVSDEDLTVLSNLTELTPAGRLEISYAPNLKSLHGLEGVTTVVTLSIQGNDALETLTGLENVPASLTEVTIAGNEVLTDISALDHLTSVATLRVTSNPSLPSCAVDALFDRVSAKSATQSNACGNAPECGLEACPF